MRFDVTEPVAVALLSNYVLSSLLFAEELLSRGAENARHLPNRRFSLKAKLDAVSESFLIEL